MPTPRRVTLNPTPVAYLRLIDSCITQLKAQGPSRTCNESKEEEEEEEATPETLIPTPETLNPTPETLIPTPETLNPMCSCPFPRREGGFQWLQRRKGAAERLQRREGFGFRV